MFRPRAAPYLERLGQPIPATPLDASSLRSLHVAHLVRIPFENLDIHANVEIVLNEERIVRKLLRGRGGFCYELNGAFAALLTRLEARVDRLQARVEGGSSPSVPFDHLCLLVHLEHPWLVDVGFGACFAHPLPLRLDEPLPDPNGTFRISAWPDDEGWLELTRDGVHQYRFDPSPLPLSAFEPGSRHHQTSAQSHFTRNTVCSRRTEDGGRVTLRGRTLIETAPDGSRTETQVDATEALAVLHDRFGIDLPAYPG